jgi:hypothetical protein
MRKVILGLALVAVGFIASCGKDSITTAADPNDITGKNNQQIFQMHSWRSISFTDSSGKSGVQETFLACDKDDIYKFTTATSYNLDPGANKCDPTSTPTDEPWYMSDPAGKDVNFMGFDWVIENISGTNMVLRRRWINNQGDEITWRISLAK